jgi:hypothetical protein
VLAAFTQVLGTVGRTCEDLQHLSVLGCQNINDKSLRALSSCTHLKRFAISHNGIITGTGLRAMIKNGRSNFDVFVSPFGSILSLTPLAPSNPHPLPLFSAP